MKKNVVCLALVGACLAVGLSDAREKKEYDSDVNYKEGLTSATPPPLGEAILKSDVGYHIRAGGHSVEPYDWQRFMDFADYHLQTE